MAGGGGGVRQIILKFLSFKNPIYLMLVFCFALTIHTCMDGA